MGFTVGLGNSDPDLVGVLRAAGVHLIRSAFPNGEELGNDNITRKNKGGNCSKTPDIPCRAGRIPAPP